MDNIILAQSDMAALAREMLLRLRIGDALLLHGSLGAGKTTLARALIREFMRDDTLDVQSPTFPLCLTYEALEATIWHYDLYRLPEMADLADLGWYEARRSGIAIVEWPERARHEQLFAPYIRVNIGFTNDEEKREIRLEEIR